MRYLVVSVLNLFVLLLNIVVQPFKDRHDHFAESVSLAMLLLISRKCVMCVWRAVVVCVGVGLFLPMLECEACLGVGKLSGKEQWLLYETGKLADYAFMISWPCEWCKGSGETTALRRVMEDLPDHLATHKYYLEDAMHEILDRRENSP